MTTPPTEKQLDEIEQRAARLYERTLTIDPAAHPDFGQLTDTDVPALLAEVRRLRTDAAAALPAWEAVYEPGNVSTYLIGYANSEAAAKGAAEAWMRSEAEVTGRLEWVPQNPLDGYDREFDLVERHDDGIDTGPGITVRHRTAAVETDGTPA